MIKLFKQQAKALRDRLCRDGVSIQHSLSLECVAAIHGRPNWDTLSALGSSAAGAQEEVPFHVLESRPSGRTIRAVIGGSGTGKSVLAYGMACFASKAMGWGAIWIDPSMLSADEAQGWIEGKRAQILAADQSGSVVIFDEIWHLERVFGRSEMVKLFEAAFERQADIIIIGQAPSDLALLEEPLIADQLRGPERRHLVVVNIDFLRAS